MLLNLRQVENTEKEMPISTGHVPVPGFPGTIHPYPVLLTFWGSSGFFTSFPDFS
jgi:hypothetical protein